MSGHATSHKERRFIDSMVDDRGKVVDTITHLFITARPTHNNDEEMDVALKVRVQSCKFYGHFKYATSYRQQKEAIDYCTP